MSTEDAKMTDAATTNAEQGTPAKDASTKKETEQLMLSPNAAPPSGPKDRDLIFDATLEGQHMANLGHIMLSNGN